MAARRLPPYRARMAERSYDVVLQGATGFAGRYAARHLRDHGGDARIALAGRSRQRVQSVADGLGVDWPVLEADASDRRALDRLAAQASVVASAVGPYARHGMPLVEACAAAGTSYADLTGETLFMRDSIDAVDATARSSGARIVHACGYDSVPSDLAVLLLADRVAADGEGTLGRTRAVTTGRGGVGGGTIDTARTMVDELRARPRRAAVLFDPYSLSPDRAADPRGDDEHDVHRAFRDPLSGSWVAPWPLGPANMRVVRRSAALAGYGPSFRYDEAVPGGRGPAGAVVATTIAAAGGALLAGFAAPGVRPVLDRLLPAPGEGPSERTLEAGRFRVVARAVTTTGARYRSTVAADLDPGYGATGAMLGQSALALALDGLGSPVGVSTPAVAIGGALVRRLRAVGFTLEVERER